MDITTGVIVDSLVTDGAAMKAGIRKKDVIIAVDGLKVNTTPELQEIVARKYPGDKVLVKFIRNRLEKEVEVILKTREGKIKIEKKERHEILNVLGIELVELSSDDKKNYEVSKGVKVTNMYSGKIKRQTNMRKGFVITKVNQKQINSIEDFVMAIEGKRGGIMLEGKYANDSTVYYYAFGL